MSYPVFIGQRVLYKLSEEDVKSIRARRELQLGAVRGNHVGEGYQYPADVVATFGGSTVNLQVRLDGLDCHWATSRSEGTESGTWQRTAF